MKITMSVLILSVPALYAITPLFLHQEFAFGEDIGYHINTAHQVSMSIMEGTLYPRWLSMSNGGYGAPAPIFYSPLFYWFTGIINLLTPSLIISLKVMTFSGFLLSGISMYIFLRNFCSYRGSVGGAVAYQLLPYHIFDLYWRGTLAETFAFAWLPIILHFAYKGFTEDRLPLWIGLAFSYAGLVLTHLASAYIFTFVITAFAMFLSLRGKSPILFLKFTLSFLSGLSLSAVYFVPMVFERRFVHLEWMTEVPWGDYTRNFLFTGENSKNIFHIHLKQIVILQLLLVITSLISILKRKGLQNIPYFAFFSLLFLFSLFISTPLSMPIWKITPGFQTIQFPWRWLMVSTFAAAVLTGLWFDKSSLDAIKRDRLFKVSSALFYAFFIVSLYLSSIYIMSAGPMKRKTLGWMMREGGDVIEYRPIWLSQKTKDFSRESGKLPVIFNKGGGRVDIASWKSHSRLFKVDASIPSTLRISTFYYPGWTALIDGTEVPIEIEKESGAMLLNIPTGKNEVLLEFRETSLRRGAKWLSIFSFFAALFILALNRRKFKSSKSPL